jgi:hypothetical protein
MNIAISVANLKGVASLRSRISDIAGFTELARDNFHIVLGFLHAFECDWLLTPIGTGILSHSFRLQGHELFREGSRFFAGYAVDERD